MTSPRLQHVGHVPSAIVDGSALHSRGTSDELIALFEGHRLREDHIITMDVAERAHEVTVYIDAKEPAPSIWYRRRIVMRCAAHDEADLSGVVNTMLAMPCSAMLVIQGRKPGTPFPPLPPGFWMGGVYVVSRMVHQNSPRAEDRAIAIDMDTRHKNRHR